MFIRDKNKNEFLKGQNILFLFIKTKIKIRFIFIK